MTRDVDIRKNLHANAVSSENTAFFKRTNERMFKELTALAPFTMKLMCLFHQSESTQYGLECSLFLDKFMFTYMEDVDHDALWWAFLQVVRQRGAFAALGTPSNRNTQHVHAGMRVHGCLSRPR